jgi:hypothetical protein
MERPLTLRNETGDVLKVLIRPYRPGDEQAMIACIWNEYKDTYFKKEFYDPAYLAKHAQDGSIRFFVAETKNHGSVGMMILKQFAPEETMCEIASQIFRKKYRGYRLSTPFFEYAMDILEHEDYSAAYCLPVLFHDISQRAMRRLGLHAAGVILNVFDVECIVHSYDNGRNRKHSQGIQVKALKKKEAGTIYIPTEHTRFAEDLYKNLGVSVQISDSKPDIVETGGKIPEKSVITYREDCVQHNLEIRVQTVGLDLEQRLTELHETFPLKEKQTAGVFLNCSDSNAVWAYELLRKCGYFFTGMRPLCGENEYMVLHNPGDVEIFFEDYHVNDDFARLLEYVKVCYAER